jgi:serine/threonine-protein kinase
VGYTTAPRDREWSLFWNGMYQEDRERYGPLDEYRAQLANGQPSLVSFRYRQSNQHLLFFEPAPDYIDEGDPPLRVPGDVFASLDLHGRLRHIEVVLPAESYGLSSAPPIEWNRLFALPGIDPLRFTPAAPRWIPPLTFDTRAAWTGTLAHSPSVPMRVEAAAWRGRPVYFRLTDDVQHGLALQAWYGPSAGLSLIFVLAPWLVGAGAMLVAWRNFKAGRTDMRGATRLGVVIFLCSLLSWVLSAHHVASREYLAAVFRAISVVLTTGALGAVLYMAVEPFIRRRWPESLTSWTRLFGGRFRDSLVGGHVAIGIAVGIGLALWSMLKAVILLEQGLVTRQDWRMLGGPEWVMTAFVGDLVWWSVVKTLSVCVLMLFARLLLRRDWAAFAAAALLTNIVTIVEGPRLLMQIAFEVPAAALAVWLLIRWGVLTMTIAFFIHEVAISTPLTTDFTAWNAGPTVALVTAVGVLAIWAFSAAMAGRPLFEDHLLEGRT